MCRTNGQGWTGEDPNAEQTIDFDSNIILNHILQNFKPIENCEFKYLINTLTKSITLFSCLNL